MNFHIGFHFSFEHIAKTGKWVVVNQEVSTLLES